MRSKEELKAYHSDYYYKDQQRWQNYARNYYHQHKQARKEYRLKNLEKLRAYDKWYAVHHKARKQAYRLRNREHSQRWQRDYYQKDKEAIKIRRYYQDEARV